MLVFSFVSQTRILQLRDDQMSELLAYAGFALDRRTLAAGNAIGNRILQVTDCSVRLMGCGSDSRLLDEWIPQDMSQITVASINPSQCVVSTGHGCLYAIQIADDRLVQIGLAMANVMLLILFIYAKKDETLRTTRLQHEVSCIDITCLDSQEPYEASVVAVGVWRQVGVRLLTLPTLEVIAEETLSGTAMPRSILMAKFEDISYLLVALGKPLIDADYLSLF